MLECTISGSPELKVKWFKDGKEMISGRKYKITVKDNMATLKILAADKGDTSEYKIEVANKVGKDQCTCSVTVIGWFWQKHIINHSVDTKFSPSLVFF